jgi:thermostable 8-oxoguanine DNA glycosylase
MHSSNHATQRISALVDGMLTVLELPPADATVEGMDIEWGDAALPMTPAYWATQTWMWGLDAPDHFRLGRTLAEELLACMLGGHGIPAEVGLAAYHRLREAMHASPDVLCDHEIVHALLAEPLVIGGRTVRYRFAAQKAKYITAAFRQLPDIDASVDDRILRDSLMQLRGVGPKTASWVLRNLRGSDDVAILDIHILRAGAMLGMFEKHHRVERHYREMEEAYLRFSDAISAKASILDSVIWMTMRQLPSTDGPRRTRPSKHIRNTLQGALAF